jgi:DNA-binding winged helix-turn-helix (wHTH) protein/tetratricopeptide (TPR) repeat protein
MNELPPLRFDDFVLDESNAQLTRAGTPIALPPKAFSLLCALARGAGKLATKDALLDAVWGHRHVSESVLKTTIAQVRAALADDAAQPRYIETVARRGYRFVGRFDTAPSTSLPPAAAGSPEAQEPAAAPLPPMIGRVAAVARLRASWERAKNGQPQLVWIAGDAGIGKTTLIDHFAAEVGAQVVAYGQCVEQFGAGEPYLPLLEALKVLTRRSPDIVPLMRQVAPMWLVQMPWLVADDDRATLQATLAGAGQERMVRELWELLERYSQTRPLLLVTEDLHWSDQGTLRLMDHYARRRGQMRLLWVATFRLTQIIAEEHPLYQLRQELQLHQLSEELLLDPFSESELAEYVAARLPGQEVAESFIRTLHAHTDGLPLFVVSVLESLLTRDSIESREDGDWGGAGPVLPVPDSLAGAVEKQLSKLPARERTVLEAASVCGMEFRSATVADVLGLDVHAVAAACDDLVRRQYWLGEAGVVDLADGDVDAKYVFRHAVYKHVLYQRLTSSQRVGFHRRAARSLERSGADGVPATAAELAFHYELGREYRTAIAHYGKAAESALTHRAPEDALQLTDHGLRLLSSCPETERDELELALRAIRGDGLALVRGIAARETLETFERVSVLFDVLPQTPARAMLLNTIGWQDFTRGEYEKALAMVQRIHSVAERFKDPTLLVFGCNLAGVTLSQQGRFAEAREVMRNGLDICAREGDRVRVANFYVDPQASMYSNIALPLAQLGFADQARKAAAAARDRCEHVQHPLAHLVAHWCSCCVAVRLDDVELADAGVTKLEELIAGTTVHQAIAPARWFRGWVEIRRGRTEAGIGLVREGHAMYERAGTFAGSTETLSYIVEGWVLAQRWSEAQTALDEANALAERIGERLFATELLLLESRIEAGRGDLGGARRAVKAAVTEARATQALGAEIKAVVALVQLPKSTTADRDALRETYGRLTEGFDTRIARRARELLSMEA